MAMQFTVSFAAACGMSDIPEKFEDQADAMNDVVKRLRYARRWDASFSVIEKGEDEWSWEIHEPEDCMMVPDFCGILTVCKQWIYEAPCGGKHGEDREDECGACYEVFREENDLDDDEEVEDDDTDEDDTDTDEED